MKYYSQNDKINFEFIERGLVPRGYIKANHDDLVNTFGKPLIADGFPNDAEWLVLFREGRNQYVANIYNFKKDVAPEDVTLWRVDGKPDTPIFSFLHSLDFPEIDAIEVINATA